MDKNLEKIEVELESVRAIERTSTRVPKTTIERACVRTHKKEIDHRAIDHSLTAIERTCA